MDPLSALLLFMMFSKGEKRGDLPPPDPRKDPPSPPPHAWPHATAPGGYTPPDDWNKNHPGGKVTPHGGPFTPPPPPPAHAHKTPPGPTPPPTPVNPSFPPPSKYPNGYPGAIYVAKKNDIGSSIALDITGNAGRWHELRDANPGSASAKYGMVFQPGQALNVPLTWQQGGAGTTIITPPPGPLPKVPGVPSDILSPLPQGMVPYDPPSAYAAQRANQILHDPSVHLGNVVGPETEPGTGYQVAFRKEHHTANVIGISAYVDKNQGVAWVDPATPVDPSQYTGATYSQRHGGTGTAYDGMSRRG